MKLRPWLRPTLDALREGETTRAAKKAKGGGRTAAKAAAAS